MATATKYKFPKALGACADLYYTLRARRLEAQKAVDLIEMEEKALKEYLIENLPKSEASGVAGKVARVTAVPKDTPVVNDWAKLEAYIKRTSSFDLLQRRLSDSAVKARWDAGKEVPGVGTFKYVTISVNKV